MARPRQRTVQPKVDTVDRKLEALELRKQGKTYGEIAKALGYAYSSGAHLAVVTALKEVLKEPAEEVRTLELERLDAMISKLWSGIAPTSVGAQITAQVIRLMERRARLLGLDMPIKVAPTDPTGAQEYDSSGLIGRLLPELAAGDSQTATGQPQSD